MHRKRGEYTWWYNKKPIDTIHEALHVLQKRWGDSGKRYINTSEDKPELWIDWYLEGSSGGDSSGTERFEITPEVVAELIKLGLISHMRVPKIGYTYTEPHKLVLNKNGERELTHLDEEKCRLARSLLEPGVHSKFSGIFNEAGHEREGYRNCGPLFFDFVTPMNERVRVYPDTKEVKKLKPEEA